MKKTCGKKIGKIVVGFACLSGLTSLFFLGMDIHWNRFLGKIEELSTQVGESDIILEALVDYSDVFVASVIAIIVALLSITITMYVFLKSALDRAIDENQYISSVANIYQSQTSKKLLVVSVLNFGVLLLAMGWHFFLTFQKVHNFYNVEVGMIAFAVVFSLNLVLTGWFWSRCIGLRAELRKIIKEECSICIDKMKEIVKYGENEEESALSYKNICLLIGYWSTWETENLDLNMVNNHGKLEYTEGNPDMARLIDTTEIWSHHMTVEQYINLFSRAEEMLLSGGHRGHERRTDAGEIITVIQERRDILRPTIDPPKEEGTKNVEQKDFEHRKYKRNDVLRSEIDILTYMKEFRHKVGYKDENEEQRDLFFSSTEDLYQILKSYRNLIISARLNSDEKSKKSAGELDPVMVIGIYYFFLRVLALFVSAVQLSDFTFNGGTFNFANFYSSTLERVSFYSNQFYHTIFARAKVIQSVLDLSLFDNIDFFNTSFADTSLNNSIFTEVSFDGTQIRHSSLNICEFHECRFEKSALIDTDLNGSSFVQCQLESVDFGGSRMFGIFLNNASFISCGFCGAKLQGWKWEKRDMNKILNHCDFSESIWEDMELVQVDLANAAFLKATMIGIKFENVILNGTLFQESKLMNAKFLRCRQFEQTSFEAANLFGALFEKCWMKLSNFYRVNAGDATFSYCDMRNCDCAEANFRRVDFKSVFFQWTRLYDATLSGAKMYNCNCEYALADHLEFTYALCTQDKFSYASMLESNFSGTFFERCNFYGCNLSGAIATTTKFTECVLTQVNFQNIRFVDAAFQNEKIEDCDFSECKFETTRFYQIVFDRCILNHTFFSNCILEDVEFKGCTILWKGRERILTKSCFRRLGAGCSVNNVRFTE